MAKNRVRRTMRLLQTTFRPLLRKTALCIDSWHEMSHKTDRRNAQQILPSVICSTRYENTVWLELSSDKALTGFCANYSLKHPRQAAGYDDVSWDKLQTYGRFTTSTNLPWFTRVMHHVLHDARLCQPTEDFRELVISQFVGFASNSRLFQAVRNQLVSQ